MGVRLLVLAVLAVALMVVDARFDLLKPARKQASLVLMDAYWITDLPGRLWDGVASQFGSRTELVAENEKLKTENLLLQGRMQKLAALTEQNVRLRELLNSSALVNEKVEVAELIGMDPNPFTHRIIINKGERDGVVLGQPVLDARGLMGQVVELMPYTSRVLLLTDTTHSIPVQVNRNGLRAIASGTGNPERLELRHVADTADIKEGDLLVSSGLGQRFPAGYPVATVKEVRQRQSHRRNRQPPPGDENNGRGQSFGEWLDDLADVRGRHPAQRIAATDFHGNPASALAGPAGDVLGVVHAAHGRHGHGILSGPGRRRAARRPAGAERVDPDAHYLPGAVVAAASAHVSDVAAVPGDPCHFRSRAIGSTVAQRVDRQPSANARPGLAGVGQCLALAVGQFRLTRIVPTLQNLLSR